MDVWQKEKEREDSVCVDFILLNKLLGQLQASQKTVKIFTISIPLNNEFIKFPRIPNSFIALMKYRYNK